MTYFSEIASRITESATSGRDVCVRRRNKLTDDSFISNHSYKKASFSRQNTGKNVRKRHTSRQNIGIHVRNSPYGAPEYSVFVSITEACQANLVGRWENDE